MVLKVSRRNDKPQEPTAEGVLGPQFGTDTVDLVQGKTDMRRLSKITGIEKVWLAYFMLKKNQRGGRFARRFCDNFVNLAVSEDGWRVNKMIQAIAGSKGATSVGELQKKPGVLQRNITNRGWEEKAKEQGKTIVE